MDDKKEEKEEAVKVKRYVELPKAKEGQSPKAGESPLFYTVYVEVKE